ncbi:MAG: ABC transporter permease [Chloroflexi bacterium]|nr:ABC transporter permease [Chloroflexota bacterium]
MSAFSIHFAFEFRSGIRNRQLLLLNYLFPLGFYLLAGAMMSNLNPDFKETMIPAMTFFAVLTSTLLGLPTPIVEARDSGILRSYKIHGIPEMSILIIPALTTLFHMVILTTVIVVTAPILFQAELPTNALGFLLSFLLMVLTSAGFGLLMGVVASSARATTLLGQAIFLPSMLIGGLMFPTHLLPSALQDLSLLLPSTHAMNLYQVFARGLPYDLNPYLSTAVLFAGAALAFGLALYLFSWDSHNSKRRGSSILALLAIAPFVLALISSLFQ